MKIFGARARRFFGKGIFGTAFFKKIFGFGAIALLAGTLLGGTLGCGYRLGGRGQIPFSTIELSPIVNEADLPQAQAQLARDVADILNREPGLSVVIDRGAAELSIVISDYSRSITTKSARDSVLAGTQRVTMQLKCSLRDNRTGKYYFRNRIVTATTEVYMGTSPGLGETQSFPVISREAARRVRDLVSSVW